MMRGVRGSLLLLLLLVVTCNSLAQNNPASAESPSTCRLTELEDKLNSALHQLADTRAQVQSLAAEVQTLRGQAQRVGANAALAAAVAPAQSNPAAPNKGNVPAVTPELRPTPEAEFIDRIVDFGVSADERQNELTPRPHLFVQSRYSTLPFDHATVKEFASNFRISRTEMRWSGRINSRLGVGFELQYHPANDGDPTQIINDAFLQYYPTDHLTITGGQFVVPFGFDNQHSSARRESPERAMFVGYFFPGHRDRGVMLQGNFDSWNTSAFRNVEFFAGVFNGNRFWADNNRQLNYVFRLRKRSESLHLAAGVSGQIGRQLLPPGTRGSDQQNAIGVDVQWALHRFGLRAEVVAGDMPSTLLSIAPAFAPAFRPGRHVAGGAVFATYQLTDKNNVYVRYDQLNRDLVNGLNIRAVNWGYFRELPANSRIGIDFQQKNHLSFNDDAVNSQLQVTWGIEF